MKISRLYTGKDGESHFSEIEIPLADAGDIGSLSESFPVSEVIFRETGGDYDFTWHNAPCRQFVLMLDGAVEIEVSNGAKRTFETGDILLAEDTTGKGHISRAIDGKPRKSVFIVLAPHAEIAGGQPSFKEQIQDRGRHL